MVGRCYAKLKYSKGEGVVGRAEYVILKCKSKQKNKSLNPNQRFKLDNPSNRNFITTSLYDAYFISKYKLLIC